MKNDNYIRIFDTTLRDGEQSPGASMFIDDKIRIAKALDLMGVDIIEAGFPVASKGDFESIEMVSKVIKNSVVCALARAKKKDIEVAGQSISKAKKSRIHTFIATSKLHMKYKLKLNEQQVLEHIKSSVKLAKKYTNDIEWSCEDASRSKRDFLYKCIELAINSGAEDCSSYGKYHEVVTSKDNFYKVKTEIEKRIQEFTSTGIEWIPLNKTEVSSVEKEEIINFLGILDEDDDVQNIYTNAKL